MLAGMRLRLLFLMISISACLPAHAQVNGVPPSVTSIGFGGRPVNGVPPSVTSLGFGGNFTNGVRPSVTSLGPNGYGNTWPGFGNCCANFWLPPNSNGRPTSAHQHRRKDHDKDHAFPVGILEPAYIPYAVPYTDDGDEDSAEGEYVNAPANPGPSNNRAPNREMAAKAPDGEKLAAAEPDEPVVVQPSTVLVFKDGHRSDVVNYAIVSDTLFDFAEGRSHKILLADLDLPATRKANEDRGVDFQIPVSTARQ
jgi:hypothetical protein